jgi:hypothetical protein
MTNEATSNEATANNATSVIQALSQAIKKLPVEHQQNLLEPLKKVEETQARRAKILRLVQEALGQIRLDIKYMMFDLEATRRERDALQEKLEK